MKLKETEMKALELINETDSCGVKLSMGYVDEDGCCMPGLVINDCPPVVINVLIEHGYSLSVDSAGLHVFTIGR